MCSVIAGLTALSGMVQYRQQQQQANAQASMYRAQAETATRNAQIENRKREQQADNYAQQQAALRSRQRLTEGRQRAQTGAAGLNFSGSAMDILSSGYDAYQKDAENLLGNQRNDDYNSRLTITNYLNQANQANAAAANVKKQARLSGIGTLLGTAASVYGAGQSWKSSGSSSGSNANWAGNTDMGYGTTSFYNTKSGYTMGTDYFQKDKNRFNLGWQGGYFR